jgi:hypothetical protein
MDTERTHSLEQPGVISSADLLSEARRAGVNVSGGKATRDFRVGRIRAELEAEDGQVFLSLKDVGSSLTLATSPEDARGLGALLLSGSSLADGRAGCFLAGSLEVTHGRS